MTTSDYKIQDAIKFEPVNVKVETQSSDELVHIFKFGKEYHNHSNY